MFGFIFGTACLLGLIAMVRRGRRWGRHHHGRYGFGRRAMLNRLFSRLETSPSQEKVIVGAVEEVQATVTSLRPEIAATRSDIARILGDESFDAERLGAVFARHDDAVREVQKAVAGALGKVHGALDHNQRAQLAQLLEQRLGPWGTRANNGPYRNAIQI
jgi:uncharacterized membrane protein